jgi:hypothetical protein
MTAGRPSLYTPELIKRARGYLTSYQDMGDKVPSIAGLACVLGVTRETCRAWGNEPDKPEFSAILMELMQRQERALLNGGLGGDFNPTITKMMMTKHGYSDKVENDHTSSDGSMTPKDTSAAVLAALQAKHAPKP